MGRSYSFEPFLSQQPAQVFKGSGPRLGNAEDKIALTKDAEKATLPHPSTQYGEQAHAETVKRYRSKAQARKRASPAAKKAKPAERPAAAQRTAAPKRVVTKAPAHKAEPEAPETKAPARKKGAAAPAGLVGTIGRKVVARAAAAAKKTVARAVTTAKKATTRKPTKKR
jgi:hypothetical protein